MVLLLADRISIHAHTHIYVFVCVFGMGIMMWPFLLSGDSFCTTFLENCGEG